MLEFRIPTVKDLPPRSPENRKKKVVMVAIPGANASELTGPLSVLTVANYFLDPFGPHRHRLRHRDRDSRAWERV